MDIIEVGMPIEYKEEIATEQKTPERKQKYLRLKGVLLDVLGKPNQNRRLYKKSHIPLERLQEKANNKELFFYKDHPWSDRPMNEANKLGTAGMGVDKLWWNEEYDNESRSNVTKVYTDVTVLDQELRSILEAGYVIGFSKRGSLEDWREEEFNGNKVNVPDGYVFHGYDIVTGQSVKEATTRTTKSVAYEQKENQDGENIMEFTLEDVKKNTTVFEQLKAEILKDAEENITKRIDTAVEQIKAEKDKEIEKLNGVVESVKSGLKEAGLVDERTSSAVEQQLTDDVKAVKEELKEKDEKITSLEKELEESKKPTFVAEAAVEKFFDGKENGKKVLELAASQEVKFADEDAMEAYYTKVTDILSATETKKDKAEGGEDGDDEEDDKDEAKPKGVTETKEDELTDEEKKRKAYRRNLAMMAGISK